MIYRISQDLIELFAELSGEDNNFILYMGQADIYRKIGLTPTYLYDNETKTLLVTSEEKINGLGH